MLRNNGFILTSLTSIHYPFVCIWAINHQREYHVALAIYQPWVCQSLLYRGLQGNSCNEKQVFAKIDLQGVSSLSLENIYIINCLCVYTPARTLFIRGLKSRVMKLPFSSLKMTVKIGLELILKLTEPLQSCCCPVQKYLPRLAELAWQLSRYL